VPGEATRWYLALAYVAARRPLEAKKLLMELNNPESSYQKKAGDLLRGMEDKQILKK
jgi:hypothetical protein